MADNREEDNCDDVEYEDDGNSVGQLACLRADSRPLAGTRLLRGYAGVEHAVLSADPAPGGMFRKWPFFQRLLSWTNPYAP